MAINSPIQNYVTSLLAGEALAPSAPAISAPTPFSDDERMDIGYQKFGSRTVTTNPASSSQATAASTRESNNEPRGYSGPFEVSRIYRTEGATAPEQGRFDKAFGSKPTIDPITGRVSYGAPQSFGLLPGGIGAFSQIGGALSSANLERIYEKIQAGEEGYGLAMLNGRVVGVGPGPIGGSTVLSGVLPQGLTAQQRYQLGQNILSVGTPSDEPAPPTISFDERMAQYTAFEEAPDGSSSLLSGGNMNIVQDSVGRPVTSGDSFVTTSAGEYVDPALLAAQADSMRAASQQAEADRQAKAAPTNQSSQREDAQSDNQGSPRESPYGGGGGPGYGGGRAAGGTVGFAEGGTAQKDPIQSTGFVDGPPQAYAKGTTVADTENHRVRVGSFVINAPTTERLQKEGKLPKGPQKMKAAKGGKMMEVALSKGEYVVDVNDIDKFGGYDALNKENDKGKPEVDRRQAMQQGGFVFYDLPKSRQINRGDRLARYNEQTGEYELSPLTSKDQQAFIEKQESFLQKQPYIHMGDVEYAQSMMAKDRTGSGYIEEGLFMDPMDSIESFKNRGLNKVFPLADAQLISYFTEIPDITYEESIGHPLLAGQYNTQDDTIQIATRGSKYLGSTPEDTAYHEILHRAFEKKFERNLPVSGSGLVEAFSYDGMFIPPAIEEDIQKLKLLREETRSGSAEYEELQSQISNLMSKANDYLPDQNHSALTLHAIDNTLKTVEKGSVKEQIKGLEFARRRARYYLPDSVKSYFDYSQPALLEKKYPDLYALSDDDFNDVRFGLSNDKELNAQYLNYVKDNLKTLKKIHSDATVEYRIALAASDVEDVVAPAETIGSQTYEQGFLRSMLDRNLQRVDAKEKYPKYFVEQQRRKDSSATR